VTLGVDSRPDGAALRARPATWSATQDGAAAVAMRRAAGDRRAGDGRVAGPAGGDLVALQAAGGAGQTDSRVSKPDRRRAGAAPPLARRI
jgi:hypothetical protein